MPPEEYKVTQAAQWLLNCLEDSDVIVSAEASKILASQGLYPCTHLLVFPRNALYIQGKLVSAGTVMLAD